MPPTIPVSQVDEILPIDGRLIIQQGEASGHHHVIRLPGQLLVAYFHDDAIARTLASATPPRVHSSARLFRDTHALAELRDAGIITRVDLAIGCLVVEGGDVVISHEEHDGIRVPPGHYYVGRQVESAGSEERVVVD